MPHEIAPPMGVQPLEFDEFIARLDALPLDFACPQNVADAAALLAGLNANRHFLIDRAVQELRAHCAGQRDDNRYTAQVLMLHRVPGRYFVRANFWPALDDPIVQASGPDHYFYDVPHDHNFDFLTIGHSGPGYGSRWYQREPGGLAGYPGEPARLVAGETGALSTGRIMHYRAMRDVHAQLAPNALSVSINIIPERADAPWMDQFLFDLTRDCVTRGTTVTQGEILVRMAVAMGGGNGLDLAHHNARRHPSHRARWNAWRALASQCPDAQRDALYEQAAATQSALVSGCATALLRRRAALASGNAYG